MRTKVPLRFVKFKSGEKFVDRSDSDEYGEQYVYENCRQLNDAGIRIDNQTVVIDIDDVDKETINNLIEKFNIKTQTVWTDRGVHFYFDKPRGYKHRANYVCKLGLPVEAKRMTDKTNSITAKRKGKERQIDNAGVYQDLPEIFTPISKKGKGESFDLRNIQQGNRNSTLYALACISIESELVVKITEFANQLFPEPMDRSEVLSIISSAKANGDMGDDVASETAIASQILRELRVTRHNGTYYYLTETEPHVWSDNEHVFKKMIYEEYCPTETSSFVSGVFTQVRERATLIPDDTAFPVRFPNGDVTDGKFISGFSQRFTPYYIDVPYEPHAPRVKEVDDYLNHLTNHDPEYRKTIEEIFGTCLITSPEMKRLIARLFIMVGDGGNGKGTFLTIIKAVLGGENCSPVSPEQMIDERYACQMIGKLANLADDIEDMPIDGKKMKILKNVTTADVVSMRKMRENSFSAVITASQIMTSNHVLKSFEKGESWERRVMWLPMYTKVKKKDPKFISNITTPRAISYWVRLMVEGAGRIAERGAVLTPPSLVEFNKEYHRENNNTIEFCESLTQADVLDQTIGDVYSLYVEWVKREFGDDQKPLKQTTLKEQLRIQHHVDNSKLRSINGEKGRFFAKIEE